MSSLVKGILPIAKSMIPVLWGFEWDLPGHGEAYGDCGSWRSRGCLNVEGHSQNGLFEDFAGKVFVRRYKRTCLRAQCPICYEKWAGKEAGKIEYRISAFRGVGRPIHVVVSPPVKDWAIFDYEKLRKKAYLIVKKSGFLGGCCIFHPYRQKELTKKWYFSPHFHMIGYGWIKNTKMWYERYGWVVKNAGVRKSVGATALYQLSHCGVSKKFHSVTWFGHLSYNKLRVPPRVVEREVCPVCGEELRELWYFGDEKLPEREGDYWVDNVGWQY